MLRLFYNHTIYPLENYVVGGPLMKLGIIQLAITEEKEKNINNAIAEIRKLSKKGADIIILPEMFNCPYNIKSFPKYAEPSGGESWSSLSKAALESNIYLVAGSVPEVEEASEIIEINLDKVDKVREELPLLKHRRLDLY